METNEVSRISELEKRQAALERLCAIQQAALETLGEAVRNHQKFIEALVAPPKPKPMSTRN